MSIARVVTTGVARYLVAATPARLAVSGAGVAIPILAVAELGDVAVGGWLVAASLAPAILAAPLVGAVLDRARHPRRFIAAASAVTAAMYAVAAFLGVIPTVVVAVALLVAGVVAPFVMGGLSSFVTEVIPDERRAYANDALAYNIGSVLGPAIVAAAAAVFDARVAMLLMAACALVSAAVTASMTLHPLGDDGPRGSLVSTMLGGLRYIATHGPIAVVTASGTLSQLGGGALAIAAVALALERYGAADDGALVVTAFAIGGLVGALVISVRPDRTRPDLAMGAGFAGVGILTIVAVADLGMWWTLVVIALAGYLTSPSTAAMLLLRKQHSSAEMRSQVFTVGSALRAVAAAAGAAIAGVAAAAGAVPLFIGVGVAWILSGLLMAAFPRAVRSVERAEPASD